MAGFEERFTPPARFADAIDQAHALAATEAGCQDFGPANYRDGLAVLLASMDSDPHFTERGRQIAWGDVVAVLAARAHAYRAPALASATDAAPSPINRPIIITGVPRTGTTALHKLLALDPQFQGLQTWLTAAPMPRPPRAGWTQHPQFQRTAERLQARYDAAPDSRAAHLMVAQEVDEDCLVLRQAFVSNLWACNWTAPSYDAWWRTQDEADAYRHLDHVLRLIGSTAPQQRWLLKNPGHIARLDRLFVTFPDALVVQTHRDPALAIPSLAALLIQRHALMETTPVAQRAAQLIDREVETWVDAVTSAEAVRRHHPGQLIDVIHADFHHDPMAVVRRIYAFAGLTLDPGVAAAMAQRATERPEMAHGVHRYDLADFGTTAAAIRERFADYIDRYDLAPKART